MRVFPVVAAALFDHCGRVLVQRRPAGKALAGLWEFPGGKVEAGETPRSALARELDEELGVSVDESALEPAAFVTEQQEGRELLLLLFRCRRWTGEPHPRHADEIRWVTAAELGTLDMPAPDRPLVASLFATTPPR